MEKVAVFPVPDWAWAITSWPEGCVNTCRRMKLLSSLTLDDWHDSALLDSRRALETIGINTCAIC